MTLYCFHISSRTYYCSYALIEMDFTTHYASRASTSIRYSSYNSILARQINDTIYLSLLLRGCYWLITSIVTKDWYANNCCLSSSCVLCALCCRCVIFLCLVCPMLPVCLELCLVCPILSVCLYCPFLVAPTVFSSVD